ncbi:hypothetical protein ADEAN_000485800 [Angomonas deanei]|uniref:Uncharacterized protein n=1 Tax=Angomonas deanei TaxID=59799 RepID=A0A7G2CC44_9TRYP|nr:hypothetical protein ADEAN_000485800 [Angomonas deanei]
MFDISSDTKHLATTTGSPLWAQTDGKKPALLEKLIPLLTFPEEVSQYYKELPTPEATDRKRAAPPAGRTAQCEASKDGN